MRLKGGKLLLDLTPLGDSATEISYSLSDSELKIGLEKGIEMYCIFENTKILIPFIPKEFYIAEDSYDISTDSIRKSNGDSVRFTINVLDKILFSEVL